MEGDLEGRGANTANFNKSINQLNGQCKINNDF